MHKQQLKAMEQVCLNCENDINPKTPSPQYAQNPCVDCIYNAVMVKTNNFIQKLIRSA